MDFTAIDFETATRRADSACQLAAVRVRGRQIVESRCWWIRPRPLVFSPTNIAIHGITPERVRDEQEFGDQWPQIRQTIGDDCIIAHNAHFDIGVLLACLKTHRQSIPEMTYSCSCMIARRTWPQRPRFGLKPIADWLGIHFQHHDALQDAVACAKIVIAAAEDRGANTLTALEASLNLGRGTAGAWGKQGLRGKPRSRAGRSGRRNVRQTFTHVDGTTSARGSSEPLINSADDRLQRLMIRGGFIRPLAGRALVFTGVLRRLSRTDAEAVAQACGGHLQSSVTRKTDLVVVGETDERTRAVGRRRSVKETTARELMAAGESIQILTEDEFWGVIESGVASRPSQRVGGHGGQ